MKYIITGATSGLGRNLCNTLCEEGHDVLALGRNKDIGAQLNIIGAQFKSVHIEDKSQVLQAFHRADAVFHCAALSSPWGTRSDFFDTNVSGTDNVIAAMVHYNIPLLIHTSTPSIYFDYRDQMNIHEDNTLPSRFVNYYAESKYEAEKSVQVAVSSKLIKATILRPRGIIGAYDNNILPRLMRIANRGWIPVFRKGEAIIDLTHVDNVVDAMVSCLKTGHHQDGGVYNITNGEPIKVRTLMETLVETLNKDVSLINVPLSALMNTAKVLESIYKILPSRAEPPITQYSLGTLSYSQTLNIDSAKKDLGYNPRINIGNGIRQAVEWRECEHQV